MLIWYATGLLVSVALAWVAAVLHASVRAPVGSISIGLGLLLAVVLSTLAMSMKLPSVRALVVGTTVLAAVAVLAQHAWLYLDYRRQWQEALAAAPKFLELDPPTPSPGTYFAHELTPGRGVLWCVDAILVMGTAVGAVSLIAARTQAYSTLRSTLKTPDP